MIDMVKSSIGLFSSWQAVCRAGQSLHAAGDRHSSLRRCASLQRCSFGGVPHWAGSCDCRLPRRRACSRTCSATSATGEALVTAIETISADRNDVAHLAGDIERLEMIFENWDETPRGAAKAYGLAIEALNGEALRRLVSALKRDPAALAAMKSAVNDEVVYAVLRRHGIIKPSLTERVEAALESIRPMLASHGGDVELVSIAPPAIEVRFTGACDGCPASQLTFHAGVKKAVEDACPEITEILQVKGTGATSSEWRERALRQSVCLRIRRQMASCSQTSRHSRRRHQEQMSSMAKKSCCRGAARSSHVSRTRVRTLASRSMMAKSRTVSSPAPIMASAMTLPAANV